MVTGEVVALYDAWLKTDGPKPPANKPLRDRSSSPRPS
jgi:hypothetical protein